MSYLNQILTGDCRDLMRQMISDGVQVQTCITSPPYWGLRDYGVEGQIGLEPTLQNFLDNMVEVFSLVHQLLADDGTLWLNMGDAYSSGGRKTRDTGQTKNHRAFDGNHTQATLNRASTPQGLKPKDLLGIPWRVAFALQESGWYLRSDIIWSKPNPMPESVTDRPTKSHEYLFLLTKSDRYYYNAEAIREQRTSDEDANGFRVGSYCNNLTLVNDQGGKRTARGNKKMHVPSGWDTTKGRGGHGAFHQEGRRSDKQRGHSRRHAGFNDRWDGMTKEQQAANGRNKRTVWAVATQPYSEAHFATFPPKLIEPCVLAGSKPGDLVFDPFMGSGTTAQVAEAMGRTYLGCELNPAYTPLQQQRTGRPGLPL